MSDHHNTGREAAGRVRQADIDDVLADPIGEDVIREDVRLGGAVADNGPHAGDHARHIEEIIETNKEDVGRAAGRSDSDAQRGRKR